MPELFEDDIRKFDSCDDINIIDIKCKLLSFRLKGNPEVYLIGFVDCIAMLQLITVGEWANLKEYITDIQVCV